MVIIIISKSVNVISFSHVDNFINLILPISLKNSFSFNNVYGWHHMSIITNCCLWFYRSTKSYMN